ncbi:MAG: hypothetical protein AAB791_01825 [Patescibacteria group bacterium]
MKKTVFSVFLALILTSCVFSPQKTETRNVSAPKKQVAVDVNTNTKIVRYYPDSSSEENVPSARSFVVTPELEAKLHLADKYDPGTCMGMPGFAEDAEVNSLVSKNQNLIVFLKQKYSLKTDLDAYNKLKQISGIQFTVLGSGKYRFKFVDGDCCILTTYEGEVSVLNGYIQDAVSKKTEKNNPC